jgi:hypothetical protein
LNKFILLINNKQIKRKFILFIICFYTKRYIFTQDQITIQLINAKLILYSLFLISYLSQGQATGTATIVWKKSFIWNYCNKHPTFTGNSYQYDPSKETYIRLRADDTLSNENSTQITNVVYEPITTAQLGL